MKLIKRIVSSSFFRKILAYVGAAYIKCVYQTSKITFTNQDIMDHHLHNGIPTIYVFWHGRIALLPCAWKKGKPFYMLLSQHRDGLMISDILKHFGVHSIFGSSTRGGVAAGMNVIKMLENKATIGITPDGPRGPKYHCKMGVISLAHIASKTVGPVHIIPGTYNVTRKKILKSWDSFLVPLPFSRGEFACGEPLIVLPSHDKNDLEPLRQELEEKMNNLQNNIDKNLV